MCIGHRWLRHGSGGLAGVRLISDDNIRDFGDKLPMPVQSDHCSCLNYDSKKRTAIGIMLFEDDVLRLMSLSHMVRRMSMSAIDDNNVQCSVVSSLI